MLIPHAIVIVPGWRNSGAGHWLQGPALLPSLARRTAALGLDNYLHPLTS